MAVTTTSVLSTAVQAMYGAAASQAFTDAGQFWKSADMQSVVNATGNKSVVFDIWSAGTVSTAALSETGDGTATSLAQSQVTATLVEYGRFTQLTEKLDLTSYSPRGEQAAWMLGDLANRTLDTLARGALDTQTGATWVNYAGAATSVATITIGAELSAGNVRTAFSKLKGRNVLPFPDGYYRAYIHPDVLKDLKDESTDHVSWQAVHNYANRDTGIDPIRDEVGSFEGFRFIMSSNCKLQTKAGDGTSTSAASADVYSTYFMGRDAFGFGFAGSSPIRLEAYDTPGGAGDAFKRYQFMYWKSLSGFIAKQANALYKFFSSSSEAANGA